MKVPVWQGIASKLRASPAKRASALSLLRGLLRECSYLPDVSCRTYMKKHILSRYKAYQPKKAKLLRPLQHEESGRIVDMNRKARKSFNQLQKANAGHIDYLVKVLMMTYGRIGARKYELLQVMDKSTKDARIGPTTKPSALIQAMLQDHFPDLKPETVKALPTISSSMEALLKSQVALRPSGPVPTIPKTLKLNIPKVNAWLRPMPEKRTKNSVKKWYHDLMGRVLPPLPEKEWTNLQRLAHGFEKCDIVQRRPMQGVLAMTIAGEDVKYNTKSKDEITKLSNFMATQLSLEIASPSYTPPRLLHKSPHDFLKFTRPHTITPRFMRHVYQVVFQLCPVMLTDNVTRDCTFRWGTKLVEHCESSQDRAIQRNSNSALLALLERDRSAEASSQVAVPDRAPAKASEWQPRILDQQRATLPSLVPE
jgi:hypothetical protein